MGGSSFFSHSMQALMAAMWKNQATIERVARKFSAHSTAAAIGQQLELLYVVLYTL